MKALTFVAPALLAMTAIASAQPMQLSAAAMDHVSAGGIGFSITEAIPCPNFSVTTVIPCPEFTPPKVEIPCPNFTILSPKG